MKLQWTDTGATTDERYAINSEHVRGEGRWYWLERMPPEARAIYDADPSWDGSYRKDTVKRTAQRLEDLISGR